MIQDFCSVVTVLLLLLFVFLCVCIKSSARAAVSISSAITCTACTDVICVFHCAESDPASVSPAVGTEYVTYGQIIIKDKKKKSGTADLHFLHHSQFNL